MSANTYTTSDLISNVTLISHIPTGNATFTSSDILTLANRELHTALMAQILSVREGYYLDYEDIAINSDGLYDIPGKAISGALSNVELVVGTAIIPVNRIEESEQFSTISPTSTSYGFFIKNNKVQILPTPNIGTARLWYLRRPNKMVATSAAAQITAISGATITVSSLPTTFLVGTSVDLCQDQPNFDVLGTREITAISSLDVTFDSAVTDLAVGDWMALEDQTPIPQIPIEFRPLLEQRVTVKVYELQGYFDKMAVAKKSLEEIETNLFKLINPRVAHRSKIIMASNGGLLGNTRNLGNFPAPHSA